MKLKSKLSVVIALALAGTLAAQSRAAIFNVANGDVVGLRNAINGANANNVADVINLAAGGIYTLTAVNNNSIGPTGLPIVIDDLAGPDLTINGNNATIQRGASAPVFRILLIGTGANVSLNSLNVHNGRLTTTIDDATSAGANILSSGATLALTNCLVTGGDSAFAGGGILSDSGSLNLINCRVNNNTARVGGGILAHIGTFTMNGCTLNGNSSTTEGGAVFTEGEDSVLTSTISNSVFSNNTAGGGGGAVFNVGGESETGGNPSGSSTLTINSSVFVGNIGREAGGVYNFNGSVNSSATLNMNNCTIQGNSAEIGGGIGNATVGGTATMNLSGCTLNGNFSSEGGAGENFAEAPSGGSARLNLFNCTISGNNANGTAPDTTRSGGAFLNLVNGGTAALALTSCTLNNNSAPNGGLDNTSETGAGILTLANCILNAGAGSNINNNSGTVISQGYNLFSDASIGAAKAPSDLINTPAGLGALGENGGLTRTHALLAGSAAIDRGKKFTTTTDQRGLARPYDNPALANASGGDGSDIGAFEVQGQTADTVAPAIQIVTPANNAVVASLPSIGGTATDNVGVVRVDLYLQRRSDNKFWNGENWVAPAFALSTVRSGNNWARTSGLPSGANLLGGAYFIAARATDAANNGTSATRNFSVASGDAIAPAIQIVTPANNAAVSSLPSIGGTASDNVGVVRVDLYLQRRSDNKYWNGASWIASPSALSTVRSGNNWARTSGLPSGANLLGGAYFIAARATDAAGNGTSATRNFSVASGDTTPPSIAIASPANNAVIFSLPSVSGTASDNTGVVRVDLYLQRKSDNKFWNGAGWGAAATPLSTVLSGAAPRQWVRNSGLPTSANLLPGAYFLAARAYDTANNGTSATRNFSVASGGPAVASPSLVQLSSASVKADGTIRLTFTGALDASASDAANYSLSSNAQAVAIGNVSQPDASTVDIQADALSIGARIVVNYDVQDTQNRSVKGSATIVVK